MTVAGERAAAFGRALDLERFRAREFQVFGQRERLARLDDPAALVFLSLDRRAGKKDDAREDSRRGDPASSRDPLYPDSETLRVVFAFTPARFATLPDGWNSTLTSTSWRDPDPECRSVSARAS